MLEFLVMILPGLLAGILFCKDKKEVFSLKRLVAVSAGAVIISNCIVRIGLFMIGMRGFRLFEMGKSFLLKYAVLECGILFTLLALYKLLCKDSRKESIEAVKKIMPSMLFLVVTYGIFIPSSLFLGNAKEFTIEYSAVWPIISIVSGLIACAVLLAAIVLTGERLSCHYAGLVFGIAISLYVQSNFLNPRLPELNGTKIDWSAYALSGIVSTCFWILCIVGLQATAWIWKEKVRVITKYISYFLSAVQILTLFVLIMTAEGSSASDIALTKEDEFTVGSNNNVIVFVLDSFESANFETIVAGDPQFQEDLENFTFYSNAVSGGAYTSVAMPLLLTGMEYDPTCGSYEEYLQEAWMSATLYTDLKEQNFDIRLFTDARFITNISDGMIDNAELMESSYYIADYKTFGKDFYQFVNFYTMPQCLKQMFWLYGDDLSATIQATPLDDKITAPGEEAAEGMDYYRFDDVQFYQDFMQAGEADIKYENTFRVYHLFGPHAPYTMNENMERVESEHTSLEQQTIGSMKIVFTYIDELKRLGLYDSSTIIITSDHGDHAADTGVEQNPMYLMKEANAKHAYAVSTVPIHFRNVVAAIAASALEDYAAYGPAVADIDENSDVERLHTVISDAAKDFAQLYEERSFNRFIIPADARDDKNIRYHDVYAINRFRYSLGDVIAFTSDNAYADAIDYRLYHENGVGIASNELTFCMDLDNYIDGDAELHYTYADVYHDTQKIRIYANGEKIANVTCTKEEIGQDHIVVIPAECIKESVLRIRMVFPNAVTPHQLDDSNPDTRVLSVAFESMCLQ